MAIATICFVILQNISFEHDIFLFNLVYLIELFRPTRCDDDNQNLILVIFHHFDEQIQIFIQTVSLLITINEYCQSVQDRVMYQKLSITFFIKCLHISLSRFIEQPVLVIIQKIILVRFFFIVIPLHLSKIRPC